jgi:hypothetical protein
MAGLGLPGLWLFLVVVVAVAVAVAVGSIWLANRTLPAAAGAERNSSLSPFLNAVALVYGALLGFTVVVSWEQFSSAATNVSNEASTMATMYRQTAAVPAPEQAKLREQLRKYATGVEGEWGTQTSDGTSETARAAIDEMYRVVGGQASDEWSSSLKGEFVGQLTTLAEQRNTRLLDAKPRIPGLLWGGLLFGSVVLIGLLGYARVDSRWAHVFLSSVVAVLLGLLLFLVFWLDHPFGRELGVTPAPFTLAVQAFDALDRGA